MYNRNVHKQQASVLYKCLLHGFVESEVVICLVRLCLNTFSLLSWCLAMVDVVFADVAQPDQARIVAINAHNFLKNQGHFVISIKVSKKGKSELKNILCLHLPPSHDSF